MRTPSAPGRLLAVAASVALTAGLAGCGGDDAGAPTGAAAFVVGARSNMPAPQLDGRALAVLDEAVENQSLVVVVVADGDPSVLGSTSLEVEGANGPAREKSRDDNRQEIADAIAGARADDPETDLLAALDLAARNTRSVETLPHRIAVVDSGLSTVAPLDFTQPGLLEADPREVAASLQQAGELPDLAGTTVVFQGLGETAAPQEELSIAQRTNLVAIWRAVVDAAGGEFELEERTLTRDPDEGLPEVSVVPLAAGPVCTGGAIELTGADVAFRPDSADFVDADAARAVLEPIAGQLVAAGATATLTGTTADVGPIEGQRALSLDRAEAVRGVLVDLGVPAGNLSALGLGSEFPGYVQDHDAAGSLLPGPAAQNRTVVVTPSTGTAGLACG